MIQKFFRILFIVVLGLSLPRLSSAQTSLTILHTNDTHSALFPFGPRDSIGGIARMSMLMKEIKARTQNVLALNAGDVFVGTFEFNKYLGYPELNIMQGMYDAMCLGNHELDLGPDVLLGILSGQLAGNLPIALPVLCANINLADYPDLKNFVKPYLVKNVGNLKIGLFGVVTTDPQNYSPEVTALLTDPFIAAGAAAYQLKNVERCQLVICLSHLGLAPDVQGLSQVPGIDIIVGGHSHDTLSQPLRDGGKIIVQAGAFGMYLGELKVSLKGDRVQVEKYRLHPIDEDVAKDPQLLPTLAALRDGIVTDPRFGPVYTKHVATAARDLEKNWESDSPNRDTPLGNLIADALKKGVKGAGFQADIGMEALGYIADKVYKGKVVGNDVMRAVPYGYDPVSGLGFKISSVLLAGAQILAGLEYSVTYVEYTTDFSLQVSGLRFKYDSSKPPAQNIGEFSRLDLSSVKVNGQPIDPEGLYWVALNEQLLSFLRANGMEPFQAVDTGLFEYNLVRDYMQRLGYLDYSSVGRVVDTAAQRHHHNKY
jgi:2',3'-cyclic-nucleotide 2'-phosphodiesterase (5'-nucleotidase family)